MKVHTLRRVTVINRPVTEVFDFFSKAENLELLTPAGLSFRIVSPLPIDMYEGRLIDYRIKVNGIPFKWRTEISKWDPPFCFTDRQLIGPYTKWHHTHYFKDLGTDTEMTDVVEYLSPGGWLEPLVHKLFVHRKVEHIFDYRERKLKELFASDNSIG